MVAGLLERTNLTTNFVSVVFGTSVSISELTNAIGICGRSARACRAQLRRAWYIRSKVLLSDDLLDLAASCRTYEDFAGNVADVRVGLSLETLHDGGERIVCGRCPCCR